MPGAETPADEVLALASTPNNGVASGALEAIAEVQRRTMGVGQATNPSTFTISAGSITPDRGLFLVDTEGAVASDFLDNIATDNYLPGSLVFVAAANGLRVPTVRNAQGGDGQIFLARSADFALSGARWMLLELRGTIWLERIRDFGGVAADEREWLGLGSSATLDNGALNAATLEGNAAADFLPVGGTAVNASALGGLAAAVYARLDSGAQQDFAGALRTLAGQISIVTTAAIAPVLRLVANNVLRVLSLFDPVSEQYEIRVLDSDGLTQTGGIRIRENEVPEFWDSTAAEWASFLAASTFDAAFPGLGRVRWDKLDPAADLPAGPGTHVIRSELITPLPNTSGAVVYRIEVGIEVRIGGSNPVQGDLQVHIGPNGDETDPIFLSTPVSVVVGNPSTRIYVIEADEVFDTYSAGDRISMVLVNSTVSTPEINPTIDNGVTRDRRTFIRLEQIA